MVVILVSNIQPLTGTFSGKKTDNVLIKNFMKTLTRAIFVYTSSRLPLKKENDCEMVVQVNQYF